MLQFFTPSLTHLGAVLGMQFLKGIQPQQNH